VLVLATCSPLLAFRESDDASQFETPTNAATEEQKSEIPDDYLEKRDATARPGLRVQFAQAATIGEKLFPAADLVWLQDPDPRYWRFLDRAARQALAERMQDLDAAETGKSLRELFAERIEHWWPNQKLEMGPCMDRIAVQGMTFMALARAVDPRAKELLRQGLRSNNSAIILESIKGLARLGDESSVSQIIEVCRELPEPHRSLAASYLLFFAAPDAERAATELATDGSVLDEMRHRREEKGVRAIFGH
jgi:hypothetical protein